MSGADVALVARQLGRAPRAMSAVVARCPSGCPAVVECLPADEDGRPFPTLFYCTCPSLVAAVSELESAGGVRRWTESLAASPVLQASVGEAAACGRRRRRELAAVHGLALLDQGASLDSGVAGVTDARAVKCLHAHVAHALAVGDYVFGETILSELAALWCEDRRCLGPAEAATVRPAAAGVPSAAGQGQP